MRNDWIFCDVKCPLPNITAILDSSPSSVLVELLGAEWQVSVGYKFFFFWLKCRLGIKTLWWSLPVFGIMEFIVVVEQCYFEQCWMSFVKHNWGPQGSHDQVGYHGMASPASWGSKRRWLEELAKGERLRWSCCQVMCKHKQDCVNVNINWSNLCVTEGSCVRITLVICKW